MKEKKEVSNELKPFVIQAEVKEESSFVTMKTNKFFNLLAKDKEDAKIKFKEKYPDFIGKIKKVVLA